MHSVAISCQLDRHTKQSLTSLALTLALALKYANGCPQLAWSLYYNEESIGMCASHRVSMLPCYHVNCLFCQFDQMSIWSIESMRLLV